MEITAQVTVLSFAMDSFENCVHFSAVQHFYHKVEGFVH